jgi:SAM-dependent methyltransferase
MGRGTIYRRWILANGVAEAFGLGGTFILGHLIAPRLGDNLGPGAIVAGAAAAVLLGVVLEGVVVGWAQARVLRLALPEVQGGKWILATALGAGAAWTLGMIPSTVMALLASSKPDAEAAGAAEPGRAVQYGMAVILGAVTGPILGFAQTRVLRRRVARAWRWLPANAAAWAAGMLVIFVGMDLLPWAEGGWPLHGGLLLVTGLAGLAVGAIHGRVLLTFAREARAGDFSNVYDDDRRARAYADLEFPGTYYLAYRDLPEIFAEHVKGRKALDFGCGTGRSTRFLRGLGFDVVGVDIAGPMIARARERDPGGDYRLVAEGDLERLTAETYDLVLSAFTFDNIPTMERKAALLGGLKRLLRADGRIVSLVSSPDIYGHEWASFSTKDYPENRTARSGDKVRIVMLDVEDARPVDDVVWSDEDYHEVYRRAGLTVVRTYRPLARASEPYRWVSETTIAPWVIYVLARAGEQR